MKTIAPLTSKVYSSSYSSLFLLVCLAIVSPQLVHAGDVGMLCYVDDSATPPGNSLQWGSAYTELQSALAEAGCLEIWVAAGTYKPDVASPGDRSLSFVLKNGVAIYGGFFTAALWQTKRVVI